MTTLSTSIPHDTTNTIGVIGAGYVGLVAGACFSSLGFEVSVVEVDSKKLAQLEEGKATIYEPGLSEILDESLASKRLKFYTSAKNLYRDQTPDVVFIAVGTPEKADGSCNLDYVYQAVRDVVAATTHDTVLVIKSTVPVGTARQVKEFVKELKSPYRIAIVNNPEFLKEGSAIADFMRPERVVIGGTEAWALDRVKALYESFLHNGHPLFVTEHETAELAKLSSNLALASRISLINQVSRLADAAGADIKQIESIMRSDSRIGSKYLYAGLGYGGSCFPKDVKNFIDQCKQFEVDASFAETVDSYNESQKIFFLRDIKKRFPDAAHTIFCIWGIAFKPETDDIRESPALELVSHLAKAGYKIQTYDPKADEAFTKWLSAKELTNKVSICHSAADAAKGTDALILATEWQEFQRYGSGNLKKVFNGKIVYDGKNVFKPKRIIAEGFEYQGVGRR